MRSSQAFTVVTRLFRSGELVDLAAELASRDVELVDDEGAADLPFVELRNGDSSEFDWSSFAGASNPRRVGLVVMSSIYTLAFIRLALRHGSSVVHSSMRPKAIADVLIARSNGELLLPMGVAASLVSDSAKPALLPGEEAVLQLMVEHRSVASIAQAAHYSERHVRRIVQSLQVKAGSDDLSEVLRRLSPTIAAG